MDKVSRIIKHIPVRVHLDTTNKQSLWTTEKKKVFQSCAHILIWFLLSLPVYMFYYFILSDLLKTGLLTINREEAVTLLSVVLGHDRLLCFIALEL